MYTQKTAGWRHLPAILGAVRDNFVNHTLPGIRASRAVQRALVENPDIEYAHELPKEVLPAAGLHLGVSPQLLGARARLGRMAESRGLDPDDVLEGVERRRVAHLADQPEPGDANYDAAAFARALKRYQHASDMGQLYMHRFLNFPGLSPERRTKGMMLQHTPSLVQVLREQEGQEHAMPEFYRQIGAAPSEGFKDEALGAGHPLLGAQYEDRFGNQQMLTTRGVPMRVGVHRRATAYTDRDALVADSPKNFLHEAGHLTGLGRHLPLPRLVEETRAWMGAEDVRKDLINKGVPMDLLPPDVRDMTPEERSQHLAGLSSYFDSAARSVAKPMYEMLDKTQQTPLVQRFIARLKGGGGT